jgi:hypothetical protein
MKRVRAAGGRIGLTLPRWLAIGLTLAGCALPLGAQPSERNLDKLFAEKRLFELRGILASDPDDSRPDVVFLRGMLANAFNRLDESVGYLRSFVQPSGVLPPAARLREALSALADDYLKLFQYGKAAEIRTSIIPLLKPELSAEDLSEFESVTDLYKAVRSFLPESVTVQGDTEICHAQGEGVPATFEGGQVSLIPDTGSGLSLISRPEAERLGFGILDVTIQFSTATGEEVSGQPSVVKEMRIGQVLVRNAVFLVVPEQALYFPQIKQQRSGTIGFPILSAMKELTITRAGCITVPARPRLQGEPNFFLQGEALVLDVGYQGMSLAFILDTGANITQLYPRFFREFMKDIEARGKPGDEEIEGVGTSLKAPVYLMKGLKFRVAGREVRFAGSLPLMLRPTDAPSNVFSGVFGLDLLTDYQTLTVNYQSMRVALE